MPILEIEGVGKVEVADDFLKKSASEQQKEIDYISEQGRVKNVAADIKRGAGQPDYSKMSAGELAKTAVSNIPSSAVRFGESVVQPVLHPIETAQNIAKIGKGVLQKVGLLSGRDSTQYADAVGKALMDRYGSVDAITKTAVTDPVGLAGDLATILDGLGFASLAVRAPGLADKLSAASRATNPLTAVGAVASPIAKGVGSLAASALGATTGAGGEAIRTAARAGAEGGEAGAAFRSALSGAESGESIVADARGAVANLRQQRGEIYRKDMANLAESKKVLDFDKIDEAVDRVGSIKNFKGVDIQRSTAAIRQKITDLVSEWKNLDPAEFHTAEGLDALKQAVGDIRDDTDFGKPARAVADDVYHAVRKTIVDEFPKYGEIMKGYEKASEEIRSIEKELSVNPKAGVDTALRKITAALRDNVNTNFGRRTELVKFLARNGATHLLQKLAGMSLKSATPRGLRSGAAATEAAAGLAALAAGHPAVMASLLGTTLASSPRIAGTAAYGAGAASRFPFRRAGLGARLLNGANQ